MSVVVAFLLSHFSRLYFILERRNGLFALKKVPWYTSRKKRTILSMIKSFLLRLGNFYFANAVENIIARNMLTIHAIKA